MKCPACSTALTLDEQRCPKCGNTIAPPVEGALAPDPDRLEPLREIPGLRKPERTWRDEVRDRVQEHRRQRGRAPAEIPPPPAEDASGASGPPVTPPPLLAQETPLPIDEEPSQAVAEAPPRGLDQGVDGYQLADEPADEPTDGPDDELGDDPVGGLALHPARAEDLQRDVEEAAHRESPAVEEVDPGDEWRFELSPPAEEPGPVERPAQLSERAQAALIDVSLLVGLWAVVVYFASRAARVSIEGLAPAWPFLVGYLALLGLVYAAYFTGTTGQTLGKIVGGLRVVHRSGRRVGATRASLRAALGVLGIAALFAGVAPMFFDPARRALHDRLLGTRVVR